MLVLRFLVVGIIFMVPVSANAQTLGQMFDIGPIVGTAVSVEDLRKVAGFEYRAIEIQLRQLEGVGSIYFRGRASNATADVIKVRDELNRLVELTLADLDSVEIRVRPEDEESLERWKQLQKVTQLLLVAHRFRDSLMGEDHESDELEASMNMAISFRAKRSSAGIIPATSP